jgi:phage-related tail fiber protein
MSWQSKYNQLYLRRGKVTHEPNYLSDAGSAEREERANVIRVDDRARVTYAAATPAVRVHVSMAKKDAVRKVSRALQQLATIADNAKAISKLFARLAGSRDASGLAIREGRAYVMRVDDRARLTYAAAAPAMRKVSGARHHPAAVAENANTLG